ncbi:hypothetical protein PIB30_032768 [Stylosanthes scabra]|uniref:Uncharacterized protein n=1 Tax=Stylosanthes scabra TaxID=79078 RepID=A0ABU6UB36_9FABA|nr:hypothetical protein [Stylosanthes scabra]
MVGPTLFEVAAITGLASSGTDITYECNPQSTFDLEWRNGYNDFLKLHMGKIGNDNIDLFYHVFTKLLKARSFKDGELNFAPFAKRSIGPNWFTQDRVKSHGNAQRTTSKRAKANPKKTIQTSDIPEESIPSGVNPKSASASEKTRPSESVQSSFEESSKEVSSKSKESTNSKKSKQTKQVADDINDSIDPDYEPLQLNNQAQNQNPPQNEDSSKGYSPSPVQEDLDDSDAHQTKKISNVEINNPSSSLTNKGILQKVVPFTPNIPIRPGTNRRIPIDPRVQFQERLEEVRAENVRRVKESVRPLPSIPIINIDADDELEDLLKVISETKGGSEHVVSNSENKSIQKPPQTSQPKSQPEKENSSI